MSKQIEKPQDFYNLDTNETISIFRSKITYFIQDKNWLKLYFDNGKTLCFLYKEDDKCKIEGEINGWLIEGEVFEDYQIEIYNVFRS